jgi:Indole-3-glycerol phosphate synthase
MFLDRIVQTKQAEVKELAESFRLADAERRIGELPPCRGFHRALQPGGRKRGLGLIAEVKKASPSKGLIRADFNPAVLASEYESAGADCISVLTDRDYFQGYNEYLTEVKQTVRVPLLRKDFIIDYRQIYEARLIGADAVLLIAAILTDDQLKEFHDLAESLGMDSLVEVHDAAELDRVLTQGKASLIGINNRNLRTFETDLETTKHLTGMMPKGVTVISESGIAVRDDVAFLQAAGADGLLIGESFMRKPDVRSAVNELMGPVLP